MTKQDKLLKLASELCEIKDINLKHVAHIAGVLGSDSHTKLMIATSIKLQRKVYFNDAVKSTLRVTRTTAYNQFSYAGASDQQWRSYTATHGVNSRFTVGELFAYLAQIPDVSAKLKDWDLSAVLQPYILDKLHYPVALRGVIEDE